MILYFEVDASKLSIIVPSEAQDIYVKHRYKKISEKLIRAKIRAKYCKVC